MTCAACGAANPERAKFCLECGTPLAVRCASCGTELPPTAKFCLECGERTAAAPPPPAAREAGARKVVTILFADLAGSTGLQERLDAESTSAFMASYYAAMRAVIAAHGGTVVKLLGDGVMAAFGVPQVAEDDALRAVRAAVAMQGAFRTLVGEQAGRLGAVGLRVAVNSGEVVVSDAADDLLGDPVNVAARLQQEAGDGEVVIGEATQRLVATRVTLAPLGSVALKGREEAVAAYRVVSLEPAAPASTAPFVARDEELGRLDAVYEAAVTTPAARLAVLLGSPGLGKSRLIDEFARRRGAAASVLTAACDAAGGATFAPLAEALRERLGLEDGGGPEGLRAAVEAVLPGEDADRGRVADGIAALLAGSPGSPEETFFVVRRFLAGLARTQPVLLVIDDLQWGEPLLLDLVEHLVQWGAGVPLFVLVAARPELRAVRSALVTPGGLVAEVVTLAGLDAGAAMRLAANVIGAADLPAAAAAKVLATSEGNPLFVGELVRMLVQEGALTRDGERWVVGAGLAALEMPPTIHALLAARIERLRPEERGVLERAAVVGRHFSRSAVAALLAGDAGDLDARLESLRRDELIERDSGWLLGEPLLRFHHVLIRDAAYRRLLKGTRAELHERLADWIEAQVGDAPDHDETVGWHLEQAHQLRRELGPLDAGGRTLGERAARRLADAGRRALARDDLPLAASLLGRAIDRLGGDDPARADLALDWCEALLAVGDVGPAATAIDELARGAASAGEVARAQRLTAWHTCFTGQLMVLTAPQALQDTAAAVAAAAEALAALGDAAGEAKAHQVHAQALARLGRVGACEAALDRALAAARKAGDRRRANAVLAGAPLAALWGPSPVTRASGRCLDVVRVLRITQGAPAVEAVALSCQGVLEALRGRTDAARRMIASSRKMVEELGITHRLFEADAFLGRIELLEGDAVAAERSLRSAYEGLRDLGLGIDAAQGAALLARALLAQGRAAEAEALSRDSEALAGDDLQAAIAWRGVRAEALAQRGEHAAAVELAQAAVAIASATDALLDHADARLALAAALRAAGRGAEADAEKHRAVDLWEAKGATLLAERGRRAETRGESIPRPDARAEPTRLVQRRMRTNAATASAAAFDAAFASGDTAAIEQTPVHAAGVRVVDHPTQSTYGREGAIESYRRLLRLKDPVVRHEPLATLGESLGLFRRRISAGGSTGGRFDVAAFEREEFVVAEPGVLIEVFAADRLDQALARLWERYAERLPAGAARERAATTARSIAALAGPVDPDRVATALAPTFACVDHRSLRPWQARSRDEFLTHLRVQNELATSFVQRIDDIVALTADAMLTRLTYVGRARGGGGAFENMFLCLTTFGADGLQISVAIWEADGDAEALARFDELTRGLAPTPIRRRVRANAASENGARIAAALAARDLAAVDRRLADTVEIVHHPTGSTYGRSEVITTFRGLVWATGLTVREETLATLGDALALSRQLFSTESSEDDIVGPIGAAENEIVVLEEVDGDGRRNRAEIFAADHLGDAVSRLYARYAERLPEGAARNRAATAAHSLAAFARQADPDRIATAIAATFECVDHRSLHPWSTRSAEEFVTHFRLQSDLATSFVGRYDDVLALTADGALFRQTYVGTARDGGGTFENAFIGLTIFGADGRGTRVELWEPDREVEALARFEALTTGAPPARPVRRVHPNAATAVIARMEAAFAARDLDAVDALLGEAMESVDHQTGTAYGREGHLDSSRRMMRLPDLVFRLEPLATLGERLCLLRRLVTASGTAGGHFDVAEYEMEHVGVLELDAVGRSRSFETFAPEHFDAAVVRFYERYAESLPAGPARERAGATARSLAAFDGLLAPDEWAATMAPDIEQVDHRTLSTWSARGRAAVLAHMRSLRDVAAEVTTQSDDVLAASPDVLLHRGTHTGTDLRGGGRYERVYLCLTAMAPDGRVARVEFFDADRAAEALARFDEVVGARPPAVRRVRENMATATSARFDQAVAARDAEALAEMIPERLEFVHHPTATTYGRRGMLTTWRSLFRAERLAWRTEWLATLGDSLALSRQLISVEGLAEEHLSSVGALEHEEIGLWEVDGRGRALRVEVFAPDRLVDGLARLYERYAASLPDGPAHERALMTARFFAAVAGPPDPDAWSATGSPAIEMVDHRSLGSGNTRGVDAAREFYRAMFELESFTLRVDDILQAQPGATLFRTTTVGTARTGGGAYARPALHLCVFDGDGRVARHEVFDPDRAAEALARFDEVVGRRPPAAVNRLVANAATPFLERINVAWRARDWAGLAELLARDFRFVDRRRLVQVELDRDGWVEMARGLGAMGSARIAVDILATRGNRLALWRVCIDVADGDVGPSQVEHLNVLEVNAAGDHLVGGARFDADDLDAAYAEIDARHEAGEGAAHPAHGAMLRVFTTAVVSRDWQPVLALCAPRFVEHDHRGLAVLGTTRGADAWVQNFSTLTDLAPDTVYRVDHLRSAAHGLCSVGTWHGTRDGGGYEIPLIAVLELDDRDRLARADIYDPDQLQQALARFGELGKGAGSSEPPVPFANAAWRSVEHNVRCWARRDWQGVLAILSPALRFDDRRRMMRLEIGYPDFVAQFRMLFDQPSSRWHEPLLASRGERLCLTRTSFDAEVAGGGGPLAFDEHLSLIEVDAAGRWLAAVTFDLDDADAAYRELDERWAAGEGAAHLPAARFVADYQRCFAARDWSAMTALFAPELVAESHRLAGWGTLHGPAALVSTMRAQIELAPDTRVRMDHVRTCAAGALFEYAWHGTHEGGDFENLFLVAIELDALGRARRVEVWEAEQLEQAQARFEALSSSAPPHPLAAIATGNAATAVIDRWQLFDADDDAAWQALRASCAPGLVFEDRQGFARLAGDREMMIASLRERVASGARPERQLLGIAGERVAVRRMLWSGGPADGRFEIEYVTVNEVDQSGLLTAAILFAADDARAAQREAWARWAAIDPTVAAMTTALGEVIDAWNAGDAERLRAAFADDLVVEDHRRTGTGRSEGREAYVQSVVALWELAPDSRFEAGWHWLAIAPDAGVCTARRTGRLPDGGEFESDFLAVATWKGGRTTRVEVFEIDAADAALARFAELHPHPLRIPPNAASGAMDRQWALAMAGEWDAVEALHAPSLVFDDRRQGLRTITDGAAYLAGLRWGTGDPRVQVARTLLATAGDRLALWHNRFTRTQEVLLFEIDTLAVHEIDADGRLVAVVLFDPADRAAASAELFDRYAASGAAGAPPATLEIVRAWNDHDLDRLRALLPDDFYLDDRRRTGVGRLDGADAYVASLAALWELSRDLRIETLYFDRIAPHGRLYVTRWSGTNTEGGALEAVYVCLGLARGDRPIGLEIFELEDLEAARARFAALDPADAG